MIFATVYILFLAVVWLSISISLRKAPLETDLWPGARQSEDTFHVGTEVPEQNENVSGKTLTLGSGIYSDEGK